ncbi:lysylphosphatidylglycerol synthase transmembrane domain-containing protein [Natrarchaeobius chitinivorans]|uniref:UPF0104 family protein n=1 Tax=Natrarchaeobius chitinivorans TaxID=1679083 RepID=A0A3N6LY86_NATCH|nr:flippase-like domain-containing protein [Natrarchaeobius chitinivorans]RQG95783.1 UPF0104 family protein [Natrarchaeobius chitinivorans]
MSILRIPFRTADVPAPEIHSHGSEMDQPHPIRVVAALLIAVALLGVLVVVTGLEEVYRTAAKTNLTVYAAGFALMTGCLVIRGRIWFRLLDAVGYDGAFPPILGVYLFARFAKYVAPYGQFAAPPGIAYVIEHRTGIDYEDGLAAVLASIVVNYLPYFTFGSVGFLFLLAGWTVTETILTYLAAFFAATGSLLIGVALVWYRRDAVKAITAAALSPIHRAVTILRPASARLFDPEHVLDRFDDFYGAVDLISTDRTSIVIVLAYSHAAWFLFALPLYVTALSIGADVSLTVVIVAVALSKIGFLVPTPGGLGGVEAVVAVVLSILAPVSGATAITVAILYRVVAYWFPVVIGGVAGIVLSLEW